MELKHASAYLPYGLQILNRLGVTKTMVSLSPITINLNSDELSMEADWEYIKDIKPILRNLSDLTKEIEHNGEKFVPIDYFLGEDSDLVYNACLIHNDFSYLPYNLVQLLLEWHFDIFALIEKGLAIDINTLNK